MLSNKVLHQEWMITSENIREEGEEWVAKLDFSGIIEGGRVQGNGRFVIEDEMCWKQRESSY